MAQILGTGWQRSGKAARINVGTSILTYAKWEASWVTDDLDTTNFTSEGIEEGISGIESSDWSFSGAWDAGTPPYDDPPGVYPRDDLQDLQLVTNLTDGTYFSYPYARVRSTKVGADVKGLVTWEASGKNQGDFDVPG